VGGGRGGDGEELLPPSFPRPTHQDQRVGNAGELAPDIQMRFIPNVQVVFTYARGKIVSCGT